MLAIYKGGSWESEQWFHHGYHVIHGRVNICSNFFFFFCPTVRSANTWYRMKTALGIKGHSCSSLGIHFK